MGKPVYLENVRASYPHLITPHAVAGDKPRWGCNFLVPKDHPAWALVKQAIAELTAETWPAGMPAGARMPEFKESTAEAGSFEIRAYGHNSPPQLFSAQGKQAISDIERNQVALQIRPGYYVNAAISLYAFKTPSNGIAVGLEAVQFAREGEPLDNRPDVADMFKPVSGAPAAIGPAIAPVETPAPAVGGGNPWD